MEEPKKKRQIVQCSKCQGFSHTKGYCNLPHRCIRCGGQHESHVCEKPPTTPATCANCGESHPANYRGCRVLKELQSRRITRARPSQTNNGFQKTAAEFPNLLPTNTQPSGAFSHDISQRRNEPSSHNMYAPVTTQTIPTHIPDRRIAMHQEIPKTRNTTHSTSTHQARTNQNPSTWTPNIPQPIPQTRGHPLRPSQQPPTADNTREMAQPPQPSLQLANMLSGIQQLLQPLLSLITQLSQTIQTQYGR